MTREAITVAELREQLELMVERDPTLDDRPVWLVFGGRIEAPLTDFGRSLGGPPGVRRVSLHSPETQGETT